MCECLSYEDGAEYLCEACGPRWREYEASIQRRPVTAPAPLDAAVEEVRHRLAEWDAGGWSAQKLANVMLEWEHDVEVLTKERNAALKLAEQRGAAYDMTWREVESLRERLDKEQEERGRQYGLRLQIADEFAFLRELLVAVVKTGTKDPLLDARIAEELRSHE